MRRHKAISLSQIVTVQNIVITEPQAMAEAFSNHFVKIGSKLNKTASLTDEQPYMLTSISSKLANSLSMFFSTSTADEVSTIICEFRDKKAIRSNDVTLIFLKREISS